MRSRVRLAALRILALREEFSIRELQEALPIADEWSSLFVSKPRRDRLSSRTEKARRPNLPEAESSAVTEIRESDPERYKTLSEIDQAIRLGKILPRMSDIRRAGSSLDKNYNSGESKHVAIPRLMTILSELPDSKLKHLSDTWKYEMISGLEQNTEYDELAEFLIKGTTARRQRR